MAIGVAHIGGRVSDEIRLGAEVRGLGRYLCANRQPLCTCTERGPEGSIKEFPTAMLPALASAPINSRRLRGKDLDCFSNRIGVLAHRKYGAQVGCYLEGEAGQTRTNTLSLLTLGPH